MALSTKNIRVNQQNLQHELESLQ